MQRILIDKDKSMQVIIGVIKVNRKSLQVIRNVRYMTMATQLSLALSHKSYCKKRVLCQSFEQDINAIEYKRIPKTHIINLFGFVLA